MKILRELKIYLGRKQETVFLGMPETEEEYDQMFKLRYVSYSSKGYIDPKRFPDKKESDDYDLNKKSLYFIAVLNNKTIASVRFIKDDPLPTQLDFSFSEPEAIKQIPANQRGEIGRLIITPPDREKEIFLPRNIVFLFLLKVLSEFARENDILGGYSFVKTSLLNKMKKLKMPFKTIENFKQQYPKGGVLEPYFCQEGDPVVPIYFITKDFDDYLTNIVHNQWFFRNQGNVSTLKSNFYIKFLSALKII